MSTTFCKIDVNQYLIVTSHTLPLHQIPSGLPRNLEAAVQRYGSATFKATAATVLDQNGKPTISITYGEW